MPCSADLRHTTPNTTPHPPTAGKGTAQQAVAAEKARHERRMAEQQRREQLAALLQAHGLQLYKCDQDSSIQRHLRGETLFTDEQLVAAARAHIQAEQEARQQRQVQFNRSIRESKIKGMLTDAGLHSFYACAGGRSGHWDCWSCACFAAVTCRVCAAADQRAVPSCLLRPAAAASCLLMVVSPRTAPALQSRCQQWRRT